MIINLFSIKRQELGGRVYEKKYRIRQFLIEQKKFQSAVAEVALVDKIDSADFSKYFVLAQEDEEPIFVGKCKFPVNSWDGVYTFEAIPPDLDSKLQEMRGSSFEEKFLFSHPAYIRAKDLGVRSALESIKDLGEFFASFEKVVSKKNIYNFSLEERILPNFQFNLIFNSVKFGKKRISATDKVFGSDGIHCGNAKELINNWSKYIQSSSIHESTNLSLDRTSFGKDGNFYVKNSVVKGNLEFNLLYENRNKEIVELNLHTSDSSEVLVFNLPIDVADYLIDSKRWQNGVEYKVDEVVVFVEDHTAVFAACKASHLSSQENYCSPNFWQLSERREFLDAEDFFFFSKMGKQMLESISKYLNLYILFNYPKKLMEFEARFEDWADVEVGDRINVAVEEKLISALVTEYQKFYSYRKAYVKVKCISLDTASSKEVVEDLQKICGGNELDFSGIKVFSKIEILGSPKPTIVPSLVVKVKEAGEIVIRVPDGGIWIQEKLLRLRGYLDGDFQ